MGSLENQIAVVTGGGGSGIGHGISLELAAEGAHVVILDIDQTAAEDVCEQIACRGGKADVMRADVSNTEDIRMTMERVTASLGRLDILVNSAGTGLIRPVADASEEEFDRLAAVDLRGRWLCCKYAIPAMQRQKKGSIINIASVHSRATMPLYGLYAAVKAGVAGLTRGIAVQHGPEGIRANTVCPGLVDGRQTREVISQFAPDVETWMGEFVRRNQVLPRVIQPEDVGRVVAFLASDNARVITGAEIPVDAGMWAQLVSRD